MGRIRSQGRSVSLGVGLALGGGTDREGDPRDLSKMCVG